MSPLSLCVVLAAAVTLAGAATTTYTTKFDNVNVDDILKNERLLRNYFNCLLNKGTCTSDGEELKKHIGDALETACKKCTEKQKAGTEKVLRFLIKEKPDQFKELEAKYDPNGLYRKRYEKEFKSRA